VRRHEFVGMVEPAAATMTWSSAGWAGVKSSPGSICRHDKRQARVGGSVMWSRRRPGSGRSYGRSGMDEDEAANMKSSARVAQSRS